MLRIYQVSDCDWVAARSAEEARSYATENIVEEPIEDGYPRELTDDEMDTLKHLGEEGERRRWDKIPSFREELMEMVKDPAIKFPCHFASTEY